MNARGGLPGFLRVSPSDGRTIVLPDYSGNRFVSSLGNIEATGLVGFTIVSFTTGDVLYLTGTAQNIVGQDALKIMKKHAAITVMQVSGFTFVKDALPLRQEAGTSVERSPYSPKVKYLVEESGALSGDSSDYKAVLESAVQLSDDLAVFKFNVPPHKGSKKLEIRPGQAIALDFMDWIGPPQYQHMSNAKPSLINDDRIRTWTVSSAHEDGEASWFELTMRELKGGAVTGALFDILRKANKQYGSTITPRKAVAAEVVGITGDFYIGQDNINALWVAGGIGVTPFLSMLSALSTRNRPGRYDITMALATKEPILMVNLLRPLLASLPSDIRIGIDIFTHENDLQLDITQGKNQKISLHHGRIPAEYWVQAAGNRDILICGPGGFGDSATEGLQAAGVPLEKIQREGFY
jgi:ferredoxin-NADP reductase